jgi:hypothetical protein
MHLADVYVRALIAVALAWPALAAAAQQPRVEIEVVTDETLTVDARAWTETLSQAGFSNVRIRGGRGGADEAPAIQGGATAGSYRVTGLLTSGNQLVLPKGRFRLSERAALAEWLRKLREGGPDAVLIKPAAFGLLPNDLVRVHQALAVPVSESTLGKPSREAAKKIADRLALKFIADSAAQRALAVNEPVSDELEGLSSGTALASILRPLGLALAPEKQGMEIRLRIADASRVKEHWPVGWPPKGNPSETIPELFKFLTVEIERTPLNEAMAAIGQRVKTPLLVDHNALARENVDLAKQASFPRASTFYGRALDRLLFQAKLKFEIRIDEADKPFLWITTLK